MTRTKALLTAALLVGSGAAIAACGSQDYKGLGDAPVGKHDESPREVVVMPDTFPNLATVCNHGNRLYVNTRTGGFTAVVPQDPTCPQDQR